MEEYYDLNSYDTKKQFFDVYLAITSFQIDTRMWESSKNGEFRVHLDKVFAEYGLDLNMSHKYAR